MLPNSQCTEIYITSWTTFCNNVWHLDDPNNSACITPKSPNVAVAFPAHAHCFLSLVQFSPVHARLRVCSFCVTTFPTLKKSVSRHNPHRPRQIRFLCQAGFGSACSPVADKTPNDWPFSDLCGRQFSETSKKCPKFQRTEKATQDPVSAICIIPFASSELSSVQGAINSGSKLAYCPVDTLGYYYKALLAFVRCG